MDADGGNQHRLFADQEYDVHPAWSPDGSKIAFEGGLDESYVDIVSRPAQRHSARALSSK